MDPAGADHATVAGPVRFLWHQLDDPSSSVPDPGESLTAGELRRGARLSDPLRRRRWMRARAILRRHLAGELGVRPRQVPIRTAPHGKPFVPGGPAFNLSHSGPWLLIGMAPAGRIGADVEVLRELPELEALMDEICTPRERCGILAAGSPGSGPEPMPSSPRAEAFLRVWVRKEALAKAIGLGVAAPWHAFEVATEGETPPGGGTEEDPPPEGPPAHRPPAHGPPAEDPPPNLLRRNAVPGERRRPWWVAALPSPPGVVAAGAWTLDRPDAGPS